MKITAIHVFGQALPVASGGYRMSHGSLESLESTIVQVVTDEGIAGYGETCPVGTLYAPEHAGGARAALAVIAPQLLGQDARLIGTCGQAMDGALNGHRYAKAALDIALWDILGKHCNMRVCDLLGGALYDRVPSYAVIDAAAPGAAAESAEALQQQGFDRLQLKIGGRAVEEDIDVVRGVCGALSHGTTLAVDANRGMTVADAITLSEACRDLRFVLEQPCNTFEELVALRPRARHPIVVDELAGDVNDVLRAISQGVADGFGLKVTRLGGLSAMRAVRDICRATRRPHTCDDAWGGDIIAAACVHVGATVQPELLRGVWIAAPHIQEGRHEAAVSVVDGGIDVPQGPGLGVQPDLDRLGSSLQSYVL